MEKKKVGAVVIDGNMMEKALAGKAEGSGYIGSGDNMLDFRGANSFVDENGSGKRFQLKIVNASNSADAKINLNPAVSVSGYESLKEGTVMTSVTANGTPRSIDVFLAYVKANATRIQEIKIKVSDSGQLDEALKYYQETPWESQKEEQRIPSDFQDSDTNNEKIAKITDIQKWQLSAMDTLLYTVRSGVTVNISILFGASLDCAIALRNKAQEAGENVAIAYVRKQS